MPKCPSGVPPTEVPSLLWLWILLGALALVLVLVFIGFYNKIIRAENSIDNAWAQIDVQLQRRGELVPNLVETVKGYAKHEKEVLENVTKARAAMMSGSTPQERIHGDNMLSGALKSLFAVSESYPDLKASTNFLQLQDELTHTENKIAYSRQHYNDVVLRFNNAIETFPGSVFAGIMRKTEREMLEVPVASKAVPKVAF